MHTPILILATTVVMLLTGVAAGRDYPVTIDRVVDGDTLDVQVDLGLGVSRAERVRLLDVYAAEQNEPDGPAATGRLLILTECAKGLTLRTDGDKRDKYGRLLGILLCGDRNINETLTRDRAPQGKGLEK